MNLQPAPHPVKANFAPFPINPDFLAQFNLQVMVGAKDKHVRWVVANRTDDRQRAKVMDFNDHATVGRGKLSTTNLAPKVVKLPEPRTLFALAPVNPTTPLISWGTLFSHLPPDVFFLAPCCSQLRDLALKAPEGIGEVRVGS
jgi:hypothetical protein